MESVENVTIVGASLSGPAFDNAAFNLAVGLFFEPSFTGGMSNAAMPDADAEDYSPGAKSDYSDYVADGSHAATTNGAAASSFDARGAGPHVASPGDYVGDPGQHGDHHPFSR